MDEIRQTMTSASTRHKIRTSPWNWPLWWRVAVLLNISFYTLMGNVYAAGLSPLFGPLIEELHCSLTQVSRLPGYTLLALGLANIYALPACAYIGKRYTIIITMTIFLGAIIWSAKATSYNSFLGARILGGITAGVVEALGPLIVAETFPEHQLSRAMVTYIGFLAGGSVLGPIFAGIIVTHLHNWRWYFGIMAILTGVNLILCVIMLPETSYAGEWEFEGDLDFHDGAVPHRTTFETGEEKGGIKTTEDTSSDQSTDTPIAYSKLQLWKERSFFVPWHMEDISRPPGTRFGFISLALAPFPLLLVPSVLVATLVYGITIASTVVYNILAAAVFEEPPFLWSAQSVGLLPVASLIGLIAGLPVGGPLADWLSVRARKKANGVHDPRVRLPLVITGFLISPTGLMVTGACLRKTSFSWVGFAAGWAMLSFGLTCSTTILTTYCVDTFPSKSGHIGVLINVVKNCIGFGVSYPVIPWLMSQGPLRQFGTLAGVLWATYLAVIPLYFFHNKHAALSRRYLKKVE